MAGRARSPSFGAALVSPARSLALLLTLVALAGCPGGEHPPTPAVVKVRGHEIPVVKRRAPRAPLSASSREVLRLNPPEAAVDAIVGFEEQLDWTALHEVLEEEQIPRKERSAWVRDALEALRHRRAGAQQELLSLLEEQGHLRGEPESFLIWNRVRIPTTVAGVYALESHDSILRLHAMKPDPRRRPPPEMVGPYPESAPVPEPWAADAVGAYDAWEEGLDGEGVTVFLLDGGWSPEHEALAANFAGSFDCGGGRTGGNHGQAVLSLAVGEGLDGRALGVAPAARWKAADPFAAVGEEYTTLSRCLDLVLKEAPDVAVLPWHVDPRYGDEPFEEALSALRVAGTVVLIAAGNQGPTEGRNFRPANVGGLIPGNAPAYSVGATRRDGELYDYSCRGPSAWTGDLFPIVSAPGVSLLAALEAPDTYGGVNGTSFAVGVAGGVAALLRQRDPEMSVEEIESLMRRSTRDLGEPGPDMEFGEGVLDLRVLLSAPPE